MNRFIPLLVLTLWTATVSASAVSTASVLLDSYAALVNGKVITVGEVLSALQPAQSRLSVQYEGAELEQKILEEYDIIRDALIESELILMDFEMQGGTLPDRAIEDHVNTVIHERFGNDRTAFLKALAEERLTFSEWRKQMKDQLVVQIMRQKEVSSKILIAPLDLQKAYAAKKLSAYSIPERVRLRTLSLPADADAGPWIDRLRSGKLSFDDATAEGATLQDDGEFIDLTSLNASIRDAIADLAPGGISEPVEIGGTRYLVQLAERQDARTQTLDEVAPQIEKELRRAEFARLNRIWTDSLRAKYYIQTFSHRLFD